MRGRPPRPEGGEMEGVGQAWTRDLRRVKAFVKEEKFPRKLSFKSHTPFCRKARKRLFHQEWSELEPVRRRKKTAMEAVRTGCREGPRKRGHSRRRKGASGT